MKTNEMIDVTNEQELTTQDGGSVCAALFGLGGAIVGSFFLLGEGTFIGAEVGLAVGRDVCA